MNINKNDSNTIQALWVAIGSLSSFAVTIVTSMILSRYFSKEDFGTYKQVMYIYQTLLTVFTLGLPQAYGYFLPRVGIEKGKDVVRIITKLFYGAGIVFSLVLFISAPLIASLMNNDALEGAIRIFSPVPFFLLPTMGLESIFSTYRKTYISSLYTFFSRLLIVLCAVLPTIIIGGTYRTAIIGFVISSFISFIIAIYLKSIPFKNTIQESSALSIKAVLHFSLPLVYGGFAGMIIHSADQFFISRYFGTVTFAEFSNGSMELPFVGMIISSCTTVLYPMFSKMNNDHLDPTKSIFPLWKSVFVKTAMLIYPMVVFCWVFASEIMVVLFGEAYEVSGLYFQIKLVANLFTLIAFAPVILSIGKTKIYANVHMYNAIILVILEYLIVKLIPNPYIITVISVICQIARIFVMLLIIASYFKVSLFKLFPKRIMLKILIPSLFLLLIIKNGLHNIIVSPLATLVIAGLVYFVLYIIYSYCVKIDYISLIKPILKHEK